MDRGNYIVILENIRLSLSDIIIFNEFALGKPSKQQVQPFKLRRVEKKEYLCKNGEKYALIIRRIFLPGSFNSKT